jgi:carbonic anhydrase/acetyltransferase-like protein (isoleucine patch superfamily)
LFEKIAGGGGGVDNSQVICSRSAHLLGLAADKEGAIVLGRKCVVDAGAVVRGDLARVQLGPHCFVGARTVLRPAWRVAFAAQPAPPTLAAQLAEASGSGGHGEAAEAAAAAASALALAAAEPESSAQASSISEEASSSLSPPPLPHSQRVCVWAKLVVGSHVVLGRDCVVEASSVGNCVRLGDGCVLGAGCVVKDCVWLMPGCIVPPGTIVPPFSIMRGAPAKVVAELPESAADAFRLHAERTCRRRTFQKTLG